MSTDEFLAGLNMEQLQYCYQSCAELMNAKRQETMVPVWRVGTIDVNLRWFQSDEYPAAADYMHAEAMKLAAAPSRYRRSMEIGLYADRLRQSEFDEMFKGGVVRGGV